MHRLHYSSLSIETFKAEEFLLLCFSHQIVILAYIVGKLIVLTGAFSRHVCPSSRMVPSGPQLVLGPLLHTSSRPLHNQNESQIALLHVAGYRSDNVGGRCSPLVANLGSHTFFPLPRYGKDTQKGKVTSLGSHCGQIYRGFRSFHTFC